MAAYSDSAASGVYGSPQGNAAMPSSSRSRRRSGDLEGLQAEHRVPERLEPLKQLDTAREIMLSSHAKRASASSTILSLIRTAPSPGSTFSRSVDHIRHRITRPTTMTSSLDGRDHLLSQQATTAGLAAGHGEYTALCGRRVLAAALVTPPGPTCLDCETALHRAATTSSSRMSHRRQGWVARLLYRHAPRASSQTTTAGSSRAVRA